MTQKKHLSIQAKVFSLCVMNHYLDFLLVTATPAAATARIPIAAAAPVPGFFVEESLVALELVSAFELSSWESITSGVLSSWDSVSDSDVLSLDSSEAPRVNVALSLTPMT